MFTPNVNKHNVVGLVPDLQNCHVGSSLINVREVIYFILFYFLKEEREKIKNFYFCETCKRLFFFVKKLLFEMAIRALLR